MTSTYRIAALTAALTLAVAGCRGQNDIVVDQGVGVTSVLSACPVVAVPDYTGDITLFNPPSSRDARAIEAVGVITDVRSNCNEGAEELYASATFNVIVTRPNGGGPRTVTLPYFSSVVQGSNSVVSKRVGTVTVNFADGQTRAVASAQAGAYVNRAAATLPREIVNRITKKRKSGDEDAALDPLADPAVKEAVRRSSFELLIGFQLTQDQLQYNVTR